MYGRTFGKRFMTMVAVVLFLSLMLMTPVNMVHAKVPPRELAILVDGYKVDFPDIKPRIDENNRVLIPVRFVSEALGAKVHYANDTVTITQEDKEIVLAMGAQVATVNGKEVRFDTKAIVDRGRTLVPLRFVSEALGETVEWDAVSRYVWIGGKEIPLMEEVARTATFDEVRPFYGNDEYLISTFDRYKDVQIFSQLPVRFKGKITNTALYNIWIDKHNDELVLKIHYDGMHFDIDFLADDHIPRGRTNVDILRVKNPDGSFTATFFINDISDEYRRGVEDWKAFRPSDIIRYIGFTVGTYSMPLYEPNFD